MNTRRGATIVSGVICVLAGMMIIQLAGCTVIGFAVGASSDSHKPDRDTLTYARAIALDKGEKVYVTFQNDSTYEAEYLGTARNNNDSNLSLFVVRDLNRNRVMQASFATVQTVAVPNYKSGKWIGLGIGIALDAAVVTVAAILFENMKSIGFGNP